MRSLIITIILLAGFTAQAQETFTTSGGRTVVVEGETCRVLPKETAESEQSNTDQSQLKELAAKLKERCQAKWGTNYRMQKFCRDQHLDAARSLTAMTIPNEILAQCARKWTDQFGVNMRMLKFCVEQQIKAKSAL